MDAPPHSVALPHPPSATEPTTYDLFVSGDYEVRKFDLAVSAVAYGTKLGLD